MYPGKQVLGWIFFAAIVTLMALLIIKAERHFQFYKRTNSRVRQATTLWEIGDNRLEAFLLFWYMLSPFFFRTKRNAELERPVWQATIWVWLSAGNIAFLIGVDLLLSTIEKI